MGLLELGGVIAENDFFNSVLEEVDEIPVVCEHPVFLNNRPLGRLEERVGLKHRRVVVLLWINFTRRL
jgi:hypothetical protein